MANSQAITTQAKVDALTAIVPNASTIKAALYLASATTGAGNAAYTSTGEVSGTNYSAGGVTVTHANAATSSGTTAYWTPSADIVYGSGGSPVTLSTAFDAVMLYDTSRTNASIGVFTFGSQTVTAGVFTLTMPTNNSTTALVRLA